MNAKNFIRCKNRALSRKYARCYATKISLWLQIVINPHTPFIIATLLFKKVLIWINDQCHFAELRYYIILDIQINVHILPLMNIP